MITRKTTRIVTAALAAVLGAMTWAAVGQAAGPVPDRHWHHQRVLRRFRDPDGRAARERRARQPARRDRIGHRVSRRRFLPRAARPRAERRGVQPVHGRHGVVHQPLPYRAHEPVAERSRFAPLPFTLTPMVVDTTLLSSQTPLVYGAGCGLRRERRARAERRRSHALLHGAVRQLRSDRSCRPTRRRTVRHGRHPRLQRSAPRLHLGRVRPVRLRIRSTERAPSPRVHAAEEIRHRQSQQRGRALKSAATRQAV